MTMKEILEKRGASLSAMMEIRSKADAEKRSFTAEENANFDKASADFDAANAEFQRLEKLDAAQRSVGETPVVENRKGGEITEETRSLAVNAWVRQRANKPISDEMRAAVEKMQLRASGDGLNFSLFRSAPKSQKDVESRAASALIGSAGGFTCPIEFVRQIESAMLDYGSIRPLADIMRTENGNELEWPTNNDTGNEGVWLGESADNSGGTDLSFGLAKMNAHKVSSKIIRIPLELLDDSAFDILSFVSDKAGERIGRAQESAYSTGDGVGKPRGIMTDAVLGKTTASATAITGDEIIDLAHSVDPAYRRSGRCAFVMNDAILAAIRKVKGSDGQYVWVPGLQNGTAGMLYGFKVAVNQGFDSTVAASKKTILFGDISKYKIRDVRNLTLQVLRERYAEYNQVGVLVIARTDGRLLDAGTHPVKYLQQNA